MKLRRISFALAAVVVAIQLVPYGRAHDNPPVRTEPKWDRPETRALAKRACFDCHSNETVWPWYSHVAPLSWLIAAHVKDGRKEFNVSEFDRPQKHAKDAAEEVEEGEMPLPPYLLLHPEAKLTQEERDELLRGLRATFGEGEDEDGGS